MGAIMQFSGGGVTNDVQALDNSLKTKREINNIQSMGTGDVGKIGATVNNIAKVSTSFIQAQKTTEANDAKSDMLNLIQSPGYRDADSRGKLEMLDEVKSTLPDRSSTYADAFIGYSSSEYIKQYDASREQAKLDHYNAAPAAFKAFRTEQENLGKVPDTAMFIKDYIDSNPGVGLDKVVMGRAVMAESISEAIMIIDSAPDTEEGLAKAQENVKDLLQPLESPMFLNTKQRQGQSYVNLLKNELKTIVTTKQKKILLGIKNSIENNPLMGDEEVSTLIKKISYDPKTGSIDAAKYNTKLEAYQKKRTKIENMNLYIAEYDPTEPIRLSLLNDPDVLTKYKEDTTQSVVDAIKNNTGDYLNQVVQSHAKFLQGAKPILTNTLFNPNTNKDEQDSMWNKLDTLMDSPTGVTSIKSILGKDVNRVQAVLTIQKFLGVDRDTAIDRVNKWKDNPDQDRLTKDANIAMQKENKGYGPLQDEYKTLVMMSVAGGIEPEDAVDNATEIMDKHIVEVGDVPGFAITGTLPVVSNKAKKFYEETVQAQIDTFKEINGGNPIQIEILNDGVAIARDATWGYKLKGYLNLKETAQDAEKVALEEGVSPIQINANRLIDSTIQPLSKGIANEVSMATVIPRTGYNLAEKAIKSIHDWFNPELSKERLHRLKSTQSSLALKKINEDSHSISEPNIVPSYDINSVLDKFSKIESSGNPEAHRPGSKYYGEFQISDELANETFKYTGLNKDTWKTPEGQRTTMKYLISKYEQNLTDMRVPVTPFTLYGIHQQGKKGFNEIITKDKLSKTRINNMRNNLPGSDVLKDSEVRKAWWEFFSNKFK